MTNKNKASNYNDAIFALAEFQEYFYSTDPVGRAFVDWLEKKDNDQDLEIFAKKMYETNANELPEHISFESFFNLYKQRLSHPPTRFESAINYSILNDVSADIINAAKSLNVVSKKNIIFGTIPSGRLNGFAIPLDNPDYNIILIDSGAFAIANIISSQFGLLMSDLNRFRSNRKPTDDGKVAFMLDEEIQNLIQELIINYTVHAQPHWSQKLPGNVGNRGMAMALLLGFEYFLIGHEYAHCSLGHLERGKILRSAVQGRTSIDMICQSWNDEYSADQLGWRLSFEALRQKGIHPNLSYIGMLSFFEMVFILDAANSVLEFGEIMQTQSSSHPPPSMRADAIAKFAIQTLKNQGASNQQIDHIMQFNEAAHGLLETSFKNMIPSLLEMHKSGVRPKKSI